MLKQNEVEQNVIWGSASLLALKGYLSLITSTHGLVKISFKIDGFSSVSW